MRENVVVQVPFYEPEIPDTVPEKLLFFSLSLTLASDGNVNYFLASSRRFSCIAESTNISSGLF